MDNVTRFRGQNQNRRPINRKPFFGSPTRRFRARPRRKALRGLGLRIREREIHHDHLMVRDCPARLVHRRDDLRRSCLEPANDDPIELAEGRLVLVRRARCLGRKGEIRMPPFEAGGAQVGEEGLVALRRIEQEVAFVLAARQRLGVEVAADDARRRSARWRRGRAAGLRPAPAGRPDRSCSRDGCSRARAASAPRQRVRRAPCGRRSGAGLP